MTMLVYMVGRNIPLYGIDIDAYSNVNVDAQSILLQAISGDMKNCSIFIIGLAVHAGIHACHTDSCNHVA